MLTTFYLTAIIAITGTWYLKSVKICTKDAVVGIMWSVCVDGEWGGHRVCPYLLIGNDIKTPCCWHSSPPNSEWYKYHWRGKRFFFIIESTNKIHLGQLSFSTNTGLKQNHRFHQCDKKKQNCLHLDFCLVGPTAGIFYLLQALDSSQARFFWPF